jgi:hypothetical protein
MQRALTLTPDRGASIVFAPTSFHADGRACARGTITVEPDANGYLPRLIPSVDVLDGVSGQTSFINPGSLVGFNPQPEPPGDSNFGFFNVVRGQTARVNVSYLNMPDGFPPGPCRVTVTFYDGDGRSIGQSTQSLDLGKTVLFDYATTDFPTGWRGRIRANVHAESSDGRTFPLLASSLEVFAGDTGKTALFYPGALMGSH